MNNKIIGFSENQQITDSWIKQMANNIINWAKSSLNKHGKKKIQQVEAGVQASQIKTFTWAHKI